MKVNMPVMLSLLKHDLMPPALQHKSATPLSAGYRCHPDSDRDCSRDHKNYFNYLYEAADCYRERIDCLPPE